MTENTGIALPPLSDDSIARIENAVFDEIADDRRKPVVTRTGARSRRRGWATGIGIAAAFVGGILIAPPLLTAVTSSQMSTGSSVIGVAAPARDSGVALHGASEMAPADSSAAGGSANTAVDSAAGGDAMTGRDIITTAQVTLRVADVSKASDAIGDLAAAHD